LYDEIMALDQVEDRHCSDYGIGFMDAIEAAAELAKKHDDEIDSLKDIIEDLMIRLDEYD
jgi:hypothetical protein